VQEKACESHETITSAVGGVVWSAAVIAVASPGGPQEETWPKKTKSCPNHYIVICPNSQK